MRSSSPARRWTTRISSRVWSSSCALACPTHTRCASSASSAAPKASRRRRSASTSRSTRGARDRGFVAEARAGRRAARALRPRARVPRAARALGRSPALAADAVVRARSRGARAAVLRDGAPAGRGAASRRRRPDGAGPFDDAERAALAPAGRATRSRGCTRSTGAPRGLDFLGDPGPGAAPPRASSQRWEARIAASGLAVDPAAGRGARSGCVRTSPRRDEITLVHGDYRLGNFLVDARRRRGARLTRHPRLGDGAPRRPARGRRVVHLAALARAARAYASGAAAARRVRGALCATAAGRAVDPGAAALLRACSPSSR